MDKRKIIAILVAAIVIIGLIITLVLINSKNLKAMVIRVIYQEGTVTLTDDNGKEASILENMKLYSGAALETAEDGLVDLSLDDTKFLTIEPDSQVDFIKSGKALELQLNRGRIFFNVTEKLGDDETMDITTSTMVVGIRGTSAYVDADNSDVYLGDGVLHIKGINPDTGEEIETDLYAGQKAHVYLLDTGDVSVSFAVDDYDVKDMPKEMLRNIVTNPELFDRVLAEDKFTAKELIKEAIVKEILSGDMVLSEENQKVLEEVIEELKPKKSEVINKENEEELIEEPTPKAGQANQLAEEPEVVAEPVVPVEEEQKVTTPVVPPTPVVVPSAASAPAPPAAIQPATEPATEPASGSGDNNQTTTYTINIVSTEGGTVTASSTKAAAGTVISLTESANRGYAFEAYSISPEVEIVNNTFTMPESDVTVEGGFYEIEPVWLMYSSAGDGSGGFNITAGGATPEYNDGGYLVYPGESVTVEVRAETGSVFTGWNIGNYSLPGFDTSSASNTFTMIEENCSISANFELENTGTTYSVTVTYPSSIITVTYQDNIVTSGTQFTATGDSIILGYTYVDDANTSNLVINVSPDGTDYSYEAGIIQIYPAEETVTVSITLEQ